MTDVFEEVEGQLRSSRYAELGRKALPVVLGALVLALVAALGWWGYTAWRTRATEKASVAYEQGFKALQANEPANAEKRFAEAAAAGSPVYATLAHLQQAGALVEQNKPKEAVALLDKVADDAKDPVLADMARLRAAFLLMDTAPFAEVERRLQPMIAEGRPYRGAGREALALAKLQHGRTASARGDFVVLSLSSEAPPSMQERARAAIALIDSGAAAGLPAVLKSAPAAALPTPLVPREAQPQPAP